MNFIQAPTLAVFPLLSLCLGPSSNPTSTHEIRFAPAAALTVTKTFRTTTDLTSENISFAIDGDLSALPPMQTSARIEQQVTVTDTYGETKADTLTSLVRTFGETQRQFSMDVEVGPQASEPSGSGVSPLSRSTVVFTRDADSEAFTSEFQGDEHREAELLAGLQEDMDLRGLLPGKTLELGESYGIAPNAFADVLHAGGDLSFAMEIEGYPGAGGLEPSMMTDYRSFFGDVEDGKASGKLVDVADVQGERIATIELRLEFTGQADIAAAYGEELNKGRTEENRSDVQQLDLRLKCMGTGQLKWNLDKGVFHALEFQGELDMGMEIKVSRMQMEQAMLVELDSRHLGEVTVSVSTL